MSGKIDIGTDYDSFREKLKGYVEINFNNTKYALCVVIDMGDPMKFLKRTTLRKIHIIGKRRLS